MVSSTMLQMMKSLSFFFLYFHLCDHTCLFHGRIISFSSPLSFLNFHRVRSKDIWTRVPEIHLHSHGICMVYTFILLVHLQ